MKLALIVLGVIGSMTFALAQNVPGLTLNNAPGPVVKLDGFTIQRMQGGYISCSTPPKDIERFIKIVAALEPHAMLIDVIAKIDEKSKELAPSDTQRTMPLGSCFLVSDEVFEKRHKLLDRYVRVVGTYRFIARDGRARVVLACAGGPTPH
jgi:hypothetical protein